jgi:hypothetical protein
MLGSRLPPARVDVLRRSLAESAGLLQRRRAADIPAVDIDDYVALNWLEWHGGTLRLTLTGENVTRQQVQHWSTTTEG